ncbi:hypothetical protein OG225_40510 (plasmid) [Nocardia sp. NBC_01377]|uniref:hypothetical protein n=1 Tax=Nocardia sp. NBC_01377 TaxID=2903595 RepID=UPI002F9183BE
MVGADEDPDTQVPGSAESQASQQPSDRLVDLPDAGQVAWTKLPHLGAHNTDLPSPTVEDLGLSWIHQVCDRLWRYSRADFEPSMSVAVGESQWRETCALAGSIAESLMLGVATYVEIAWHEEAIRTDVEDPAMALAQRLHADALCEAVIAVGHRLINLVSRVMRTDPEIQQRMSGEKRLKALGPSYRPFVTDASAAWLSLTENTVQLLRAVSTPCPSGVEAALDR